MVHGITKAERLLARGCGGSRSVVARPQVRTDPENTDADRPDAPISEVKSGDMDRTGRRPRDFVSEGVHGRGALLMERDPNDGWMSRVPTINGVSRGADKGAELDVARHLRHPADEFGRAVQFGSDRPPIYHPVSA